MLILIGVASLMLNQPFQTPTIIGGIAELIFAIIIIRLERKIL